MDEVDAYENIIGGDIIQLLFLKHTVQLMSIYNYFSIHSFKIYFLIYK